MKVKILKKLYLKGDIGQTIELDDKVAKILIEKKAVETVNIKDKK